MMFETLFLGVCCLVVQRLVQFKFVKTETLEFSGYALLENSRFWTPITAGLIHAGLWHELNNVLFTIGIAYTAETLQLVPKGIITFVFIFGGIFGRFSSLAYLKTRHGAGQIRIKKNE